MLKEAASTTRDSTVNVKQLFDLTGRVAIVTGGSIGLGRQMAEGLAEMGADLVLCARKKERCHQAAEELQQLGVKAIALGCDVKNPDSIQEMVEATLSQFGRIDVLINNAGISWGAPVEEMRLEDWNKVIETNLTGTFLCAQAVGKVMIRQGRGENGASRTAREKSLILRQWLDWVGLRRNFQPLAITPARVESSVLPKTWPANGQVTTFR